jgi:hypothetical protein
MILKIAAVSKRGLALDRVGTAERAQFIEKLLRANGRSLFVHQQVRRIKNFPIPLSGILQPS